MAPAISNLDLQIFKQQLLDEIKKIMSERQVPLPQRWLKSRQIRKLLSISPGKLQAFRSTGILPYSRIGNMIFYDYYEVEQLLLRSRHRAVNNDSKT